MSAPSFLQVPIRLRHEAPDFHERLASLGMLCLRAKNLTAELVAIADPGETVLEGPEQLLFPSLGLSVLPGRIAGVHAMQIVQLPRHPSVIEFDFEHARFPLGIAIPGDLNGSKRLQEFVAAFCEEEVEIPALLKWRATLAEPFQSCPCCQAAAEQRRAHPEAHPLAPILSDAIDFGLELHCRITGEGFDFSRFIDPRRMSFQQAIALHDDHGDGILRIDPAHAHAIWVLPVRVDGETRTAVRIYDTLGSMNLEFSVPGDAFVAPWQRYCAAACS